jgi:phosphate transport system substrate-binding protein
MKTTVLRSSLAALLLLAAACGETTTDAPDAKPPGPAAAKEAVRITGAGSSFANPILTAWAHDYNQITGVELNYQSIGSGGGIQQIKKKTVNFGASDAPMTAEELEEAGLVQFPFIMGGVVPVFHIEGVEPGALKLDASTLAGIYLAKITKWNDSAIQALNPGVALPDKEITVVHRSDGSGTTWIFTNYLVKVSDEWKAGPGTGKSVQWPTGVGGKGNEGIANYVQRLDGAIGYVEYAYALQNKLSYALLKNKDGNFVQPSMETFQAAASGADWANAPGFRVVLTDQPGAQAWPITGAVYALMHTAQDDGDTGKAALAFFDWAYKNGTEAAERLHYVPMPADVVSLVQSKWTGSIRAGGSAVWQ